MAAAGWQESLNEIRTLLKDVVVENGRAQISPELVEQIQTRRKGWDANRTLYTFGQIEAEKAAVLARAGAIEWWHATSGHGFFGDLPGIRRIREMFDADPGLEKEAPDYSSTLTWSCFPHTITDGVTTNINAGVVAQLFEWGADHNNSNGKFYGYVLNQSPASIIKLFLDNGAPVETARLALQEQMGKKNFTQAQRLQEAMGLGGFFSKIDAETILETKYIDAPDGIASLKTIFNFGARRVNEIYTAGLGKEAVSTMTSIDFAQVDSAALRRAQERLEELGGRPPDVLDKPKLAKTGGLQNG